MPTKSKILVHGHRGSRGTHPENTLPAFQEAVDAGADVLELDLHLTADDVVIIMHDPELTGRLCKDASGNPVATPIPVRRLKAAEIAKYDCGSLRNPRFPEQTLLPGTRVPTLRELLEWRKKTAPQISLNIETKMTAPSEDLVPPPELFVNQILDLLREYRAIDATILQSFDFRTLTIAKTKEPKLQLSCLFESEEKNICARTKEVGAQWISPNFSHVNAALVAECHKNKIRVVPWTLNLPQEWDSARQAGVDAIISDYPRKLISHLKSYESPRP